MAHPCLEVGPFHPLGEGLACAFLEVPSFQEEEASDTFLEEGPFLGVLPSEEEPFLEDPWVSFLPCQVHRHLYQVLQDPLAPAVP